MVGTEVELHKHLEEHPDATVLELRDALGLKCSEKTLWQTLRKMGWRFKKKSSRAAEQDRADVVVKRKDWHATQETVDAERLVFLDETGLKTNFTRPTCYIHVFIMCLATTFQDKSAPFHCHIP